MRVWAWVPQVPHDTVVLSIVPGVQPVAPVHVPTSLQALQVHAAVQVRSRDWVPDPQAPHDTEAGSVTPGMHPVSPAQALQPLQSDHAQARSQDRL